MTRPLTRTLSASWPALRNVASWAVGVYWGSVHVVGQPGPTDWGDVFLVAACMSLPLAYRFDEAIKSRLRPGAPATTTNGSEDGVSSPAP